jgi:hypothetical protein
VKANDVVRITKPNGRTFDALIESVNENYFTYTACDRAAAGGTGGGATEECFSQIEILGELQSVEWACPHCGSTEGFTESGYESGEWVFSRFNLQGEPRAAEWCGSGDISTDKNALHCDRCGGEFSRPRCVYALKSSTQEVTK